MLDRPPNTKGILHYDTTSHCQINGEWPSTILSFSAGTDFELCSLFFACEDREQVVLLLVKTIKRSSVAATRSDEFAKKSWENLFALMTDSASKNLKIVDGISESLGSTYKLIHLLCKSYRVEKLNTCNLEVLLSFETKVKQCIVLESINPQLKSFFRGKKSTVEAGIESVLKLVTHRHSGNTTSQADRFNHICEREGVVKCLVLYQKTFIKLGKSAASLLGAYPILKMVEEKVADSNQLVEACKIYLASEIFKIKLEVLAFFTHNAIFPFLHCVEKSTQDKLLVILPKLFKDLKDGIINPFSKFVLTMRQVPVHKPSTELGIKLLHLMSLKAAKGIMLQ